MTTLNIRGAALRAAQSVNNTGGATESILCGVAAPASGYIVSLSGHEERHTGYDVWRAGWLADLLTQYAERHQDVLAQPGYFLGAWIHEGDLYVDVSQVVADRQEALWTAEGRDQIAFWDIEASEEITVRKSVSSVDQHADEAFTVIAERNDAVVARWVARRDGRTPQQQEIAVTSAGLLGLLNRVVPSSTAHYAVEDLRRALEQILRAPFIRTVDVD